MSISMKVLVREAVKEALHDIQILKVDVTGIESVKLVDSQDNIINPATEDTLAEISQKVATEATLSVIKAQVEKLQFDPSGNLKVATSGSVFVALSWEEASPLTTTTYTTPSVDLTDGPNEVWVYVLADQQVTVQVEGSFDGSEFFPLAGYGIDETEFIINELNNIGVAPKVPHIRVSVTTGTTAPTSIRVWIVKKY